MGIVEGLRVNEDLTYSGGPPCLGSIAHRSRLPIEFGTIECYVHKAGRWNPLKIFFTRLEGLHSQVPEGVFEPSLRKFMKMQEGEPPSGVLSNL